MEGESAGPSASVKRSPASHVLEPVRYEAGLGENKTSRSRHTAINAHSESLLPSHGQTERQERSHTSRLYTNNLELKGPSRLSEYCLHADVKRS